MPTFVIISIACAVAVGMNPDSMPTEQTALRCAFAGGTVFITCLMARVMVVACGDTSTLPGSRQTESRRRTCWQRWHLLVWLGMSAFLILGLHWGTVVRVNWKMGSFILIDEVIILAPMLLPWLVTWAVLYDLDPTRKHAPLLRQRSTFVLHHARIVFGLGLLPVLTVCLVRDVFRMLHGDTNQAPIPNAFFAIPLALILIGYPVILKVLWKAIPLPAGHQRTILQRFATNSGIPIHRFYLWDLDGSSMNAAIAGLIPQLRCFFFSHGLLHRLPDDEILAAAAHEFGHQKHRHLVLRMAALFFPVTSVTALQGGTILAGLAPMSPQGAFEASPAASPEMVTVLTTAVALLYIWLAVGFYARRLEIQADGTGWHMLSGHLGCKDKALETYIAMLVRVSGKHTKKTWLHPSLDQRLESLRRTRQHPDHARRWNRILAGTEGILIVTTAAAILVMLVGC